MGVGTFSGTVTRGIVNRNKITHLRLDLDGIGPVRGQANCQLFEGGLRSGYIPAVGDRVSVMGNFNDQDFIDVYAINREGAAK